MDKYIESCLALYDLKVNCHYNKPTDINKDYKYYFFEQQLSSGLKLKCRSDGYYVFDFIKSPIGKPIKYEDFTSKIYVKNERVEIMHAFLACLRCFTQKSTRKFHTFDMDFLDNFIICNRSDYDLSKILASSDSNCFSSNEYMELCKSKMDRVQSDKIKIEIDNTKVLDKVCETLEQLMQYDNGQAAYILGILYRAAVYHKLGLEIHSVIFTRSVYEWLATRQYPRINNKKTAYEELLDKHNIKAAEKEQIMKLACLRGDAVHKLKFPKQNGIPANPISKCFKVIERIFNKEFNVDIQIPLGQSQFSIIEEY